MRSRATALSSRARMPWTRHGGWSTRCSRITRAQSTTSAAAGGRAKPTRSSRPTAAGTTRKPMALAIEDYALIGDRHAAALVGRDGSIDWLCLPRFDSDACFAALLGEPRHGRWLIAPAAAAPKVTRRYRDGTLILETDFETSDGAVRLIDFMALSDDRRDVVRIVEGLRGRVPMHMELIIRFDYGSIVPWVRQVKGALVATAGPDTLELETQVATRGEGLTTVADFTVAQGERVPFTLNYHLS